MSASPTFSVNGRFLTQPVTGVQRYARNVVSAMNAILSQRDTSSSLIIAPESAIDLDLPAMPLLRAGPLSGHLWEQTILPLKCKGRLLNLCNTAPALKSDQVLCIHDANIFVTPESYSSAFRAVYTTLHQHLARHAARVVTVSNFSALQISRYLGVRASAIVVLPNGHEHALDWNPTLARIAPSICDQATALSDGRFVLALGSRARHKNLKLLIQIAPELATMGINIVIAGGDSGIFAGENLPSVPNVMLTGYVTDHDLAYLMDRALCLVFPSWTEGFGLPIVEAMARGCPVISSDRASMPEVGGDAVLLAQPDDPSAWIHHIRTLAQSADLRRTLVERGYESVKRFSWVSTANGYIDLMQEPKTYSLPTAVDAQPLPKIAVVIATLGRADVVTATVKHLLENQTLKPATVIVSCVAREDAGAAADIPGVTVVTGRSGSSAQRNAAFKILPPDIEVVVFFDDDFVADAKWLAAAGQAFRAEPDIFGFTGDVIADGVKGPGLSFEEAIQIVRDADGVASSKCIEPYSPYGCNMAFRLSAVGDLRFDERLVLYGWLEDRDFGSALTKSKGRLVKCFGARGVHMGVKRGRGPGNRLGYSQVVNPIYLLSKKTMTLGQVADHIVRNILSNLARSLKPEPFIDRRGRLRGNVRALADIIQGHVEPERAAGISIIKDS